MVLLIRQFSSSRTSASLISYSHPAILQGALSHSLSHGSTRFSRAPERPTERVRRAVRGLLPAGWLAGRGHSGLFVNDAARGRWRFWLGQAGHRDDPISLHDDVAPSTGTIHCCCATPAPLASPLTHNEFLTHARTHVRLQSISLTAAVGMDRPSFSGVSCRTWSHRGFCSLSQCSQQAPPTSPSVSQTASACSSRLGL